MSFYRRVDVPKDTLRYSRLPFFGTSREYRDCAGRRGALGAPRSSARSKSHDAGPCAHWLTSSSGTPRMYSTLLHRISTSPRLPENSPSIHSSVDASCRFMYESTDTRYPARKHQGFCAGACQRRAHAWLLERRRGGNIVGMSCGTTLTLVLHAPLELGDDGLASQVVQERLRVDGHPPPRRRLHASLVWCARALRREESEKRAVAACPGGARTWTISSCE